MPSFREDFARVEEGALPEGWAGDDAIVVRRGDDRARLEVSGKGQHAVTLSKVRIEGDFYLECEFALAWEHPRLELTLAGKEGAPDLTLAATATGAGTNVSSTLRVILADLDPRESTKLLDPPLYKLRLERQGAIYRVKVNGESVVAQPLRGYGNFVGLRLALPGESEARFYAIQWGPLAIPKGP